MADILTSWTFWVFGGFVMLSLVKVVSGRVVEVQKIRAQERHWRRQQDGESERRLMGLDESQEIAGLKLRIEALEQEVARLRGASAPGRRVAPASAQGELDHQDDRVIRQ
jgi:hypothetical protein